MHEFWTFDGLPRSKCALVIPDSADLTYGTLADRADAWAERLQQLSAGQRCLVALEFDINPESIAAYLGALRAGYPVLILEPGQLVPDSRIEAVWLPEIYIAAGASSPTLRYPPDKNTAPPHPDLRVLLSTSGSTGDPKLVRLSARNIASNAASIVEYLALTPDDRAAITLPFHYSYGLSVLNSYLAIGASLILTRHSVIDPTFWDEARSAGATSLALVPHQVELLANSGFTSSKLPSLRYMTQAGGNLPLDLVRRFEVMSRGNGWQLFIMYGQTEAAPRISYVPPEALPGAAGTIGKAIPGGRIWLAAEDGSEITTPGKPGELVYEGPNVMMGYALTRADLTRGHDITELRTGDIAECTSDGFFRITGRLKRFVKLFGLRLSLDQVETLLRDKGIPAHAVAVDDNLVLMHSSPNQGEDARAAIAAEYDLPESAIHAGYLAELPLLSSGKPDHKALRTVAESALSQALAYQQLSAAKESISEMIRRATRSANTLQSDSFTSLGGDSLSYIQVQMALEERLGVVPEGWERLSLVQLEALATQASPERRPNGGIRIGADVLLRLLAISLVVAQHASSYSLFGGTWMLIAIMGYSTARFQMHQIADGKALRFVFRMLYPIIPFYFLLLILYGTLRDKVPLEYWILVGNYTEWSTGSLLQPYWFVSLYAQIIITIAAITAVRPLRQVVISAPWRTVATATGGLILLLTGIALLSPRDEIGLVDFAHYPQRGLPECMSIFALGWMLRLMRGRTQMAITFAMAICIIALWTRIDMSLQVGIFLCFTLMMLALNPSITVPRTLGQWINRLASATLFVYLLHMVVLFVTIRLPLPQPATIIITLVVTFALSLLVKYWFDLLDDRLMALFTNSRRLLRENVVEKWFG